MLCPFSYDGLSFKSTILFAIVLQKINPEVEVCFIPNRIKSKVKYETREQIDEQLGKFGLVTLAIPDRIDFQRVSTIHNPEIILPVIQPVLDQIYVTHLSFLLDDFSQ